MTVTQNEGHFRPAAHVDIFYRQWSPTAILGTILITHGVGEHSDAYQQTAQDLAKSGYQVFAWDVRGHGMSSGKRGHVSSFSHFCEDLHQLILFLADKFHQKNQPFFLFGHSMGGLITLKTYLNFRPKIVTGLILSSPTIGLNVPAPLFAIKFIKYLATKFPNLTFNSLIGARHLTRSPKFRQTQKLDKLRHNRASFSLLAGTLDAVAEINTSAEKFDIPILMVIARKDPLVSSAAAELFFKKIKSDKKKIVIFKHSRHEVFNDLNRAEAIQHAIAFVKNLSPQTP